MGRIARCQVFRSLEAVFGRMSILSLLFNDRSASMEESIYEFMDAINISSMESRRMPSIRRDKSFILW